MNTEPKKNQIILPEKLLQAVQFVFRNWPWKLLALFLAVCLWAGLISQDPSLTRERTFSDVQLSISGADMLKRNAGLIVISGLEEENLSARLRVNVPQREYANVTSANYNPRVDLTRVTKSGEQTLRVVTTSSSTYGNVQDISPSTINVVVDEYVTNYRVPVAVNILGDYPDGFYGSAISLDPSIVSVSGPRSLVDQIARVSVEYDPSRLTPKAGVVRAARAFQFIGRDGEVIESDLLEVTSANVVLRSIILEQVLYPMASIMLDTSDLTTGVPAPGYRIKNVTLSPAALEAAGTEEALETVRTLFISEPVDVSGKTESFTQTVRTRKPSELAYLNTETITVSVEIEPVEIARTFDSIKLSVRGIQSSLKSTLDTKAVSVVITGPQLTVEKLRAANLNAYVDASQLQAGEHDLPVYVHVEGKEADNISYHITPETVQLTLKEK